LPILLHYNDIEIDVRPVAIARNLEKRIKRYSVLLSNIFLFVGGSVSGEYSVKDPGGTFRVVSYHADKEGFHAVVHTSGKNDHSGGVYGGQGQETETQSPFHEYAAALSAHAGY